MFTSSCTSKWNDLLRTHGTQWYNLTQLFDHTFFRIRVLTANVLENTIKAQNNEIPLPEFYFWLAAVNREIHRETINAVHFVPFLSATTDPTLAAAAKQNHKELKTLSVSANLPGGFGPGPLKPGSSPSGPLSGNKTFRANLFPGTGPDDLCIMHPSNPVPHSNQECHAQRSKRARQAGPNQTQQQGAGSNGTPSSGNQSR
jgi:hypothetical protein